MLMREQRIVLRYVVTVGILMILLFWMASRTFGQETTVAQQTPVTSPAVVKPAIREPAFKDYRGIKIGISADDVRSLVDQKPQSQDKSGYFYVFSDSETAQVLLDENNKVRAIAVTFLGKDANAPSYEAVFGKDVPVKQAADGRIYNMVTYPALGYWIAYSSLGPDAKNPLVSITIQSTGN